jgi:ribokinase
VYEGLFLSSGIGDKLMDELIVVGSINMDLIVKVKHLPSRGETVTASHFQEAPGGKGANQAVAAARLGAIVRMIGRVGSDPYGEALLKNLVANNVDTSCMLKDSYSPTGTALVTVDEAGRNTIVVYPGANGMCLPADVEAAEDIIKGAKALVVQLEIPLDVMETALQVAKRHSLTTVLNPAPAQAVTESALSLVDILIPNEVEATTLSGLRVVDPDTALKAAERLICMGPRRVVITLGEHGAVYAGPEGKLHSPAFIVDSVDSTGAGDAFIAAFTVAWMGGLGAERSLRYACAAGAITTTRVGAQSSLPTRDEVSQFYAAASQT